MNVKIQLVLFFSVICLITSCSSYKEISYFQDVQQDIQGVFSDQGYSQVIKIRPDDELSIVVSSIEPLAAAPFNLPVVMSASSASSIGTSASGKRQTGMQLSNSQMLQTYLVDSNGEINFPVIGRIKVSGLSREEFIDYLEELLKEYIKDPIVNVQIVNFKVSVLGEVVAPGPYYYTNQRVSVLDAIASAHDLTTHGARDNVMVIRDIEGKKEYFRFDLTKSDIFTSSNFYLQQNDVVYISPNKEKQRDAATGQQKQFNLTVITSAIGYVISVIAILVR